MDDELHDLIGAYAVDALEPDERAAFEQHLTDCPDCRHELASLGDTLAELSDDYAVEPPAGLRDQVLGAVAKLTEPTPLPRRAVEPSDSGPEHEDAGTPATVTPLKRPAPSSGRSRWQVLVAAAVAVIAVIGIAVWQPWAPRPVTAADVLAAPDAVRSTGPAEGGGSVTYVRSNQLGRAVLVTQDVAAAPSGKAHQAWLQQPSGAMVSGGMMPDGPDVTMLLEGDARDTVGGAISVEPPGGSAQPTGEVVALVGL